MKDLVGAFLTLRQVVLHPFEGCLSTSKAFLLVAKHCHVVTWEEDVDVKLIPALIEVYSSQLMNQALELTWDDDLMKAVCVYLEVVAQKEVMHSIESWRPHLY